MFAYQFDEAETADRLFTMPDGSQKMHPTMHQMAGLGYLWAEGFQAVRLPYGDDVSRRTESGGLGGLDGGVQ